MLLFLILALAGCVSEEQEQQLGDSLAADINVQLPLVRDPATVDYVERLGRQIAAQSERPHVPYRFYIVNSSIVNAFALPGGHIYVTRGLIERTQTASQLAAVLAHEIGHVAARHGVEALEREMRTGSVVSMLYHLFLGREPSLLDQSALQLGGRLWAASHSRRAEREADRLAVRYLVRAGMDPGGMITMLEGLLEEEAEEMHASVEWFSTHPTTVERVRTLRRKVDGLREGTPPALVQDLASYSAFLQRLAALPPPLDLAS